MAGRDSPRGVWLSNETDNEDFTRKRDAFFREVERPSREGLLTWKRSGVVGRARETSSAFHHLTH